LSSIFDSPVASGIDTGHVNKREPLRASTYSKGGAMDGDTARTTLIENINSAFSAENIRISVGRLRGLSRRADFLTISRTLGILHPMDDATFRRYRRNLTIPRAIQQILTSIHHAALYADPPMPMRIQINDAPTPAIEVTVTDQLISIRLDRPAPQHRER
jgi:hypothetical protein